MHKKGRIPSSQRLTTQKEKCKSWAPAAQNFVKYHIVGRRRGLEDWTDTTGKQ